MKKRIQKILSEQGYYSRRAAEKLIVERRVKLNGRIVELGDGMDIDKDYLSIDGKNIVMNRRREMVYYLLNKPRGVVTTVHDDHASKTVIDLLDENSVRVFPVGRLDKDSEGLLILTNDGDLANLMAHPSTKIKKIYRVTVRPCPVEEQLIQLTEGVVLDDGYATKPMTLRFIAEEADRGVLEFVISEGKNRMIRRMCDAVGLSVIRLKRTAIGPLKLNGIAPGQYREFKKAELIAVRNACSVTMEKKHD